MNLSSNAKRILSFSVGPIGAAILGIVSLPLMAWYFSPQDIGRISMLQLAINFGVLLFSLGLDQSYVREYHGTDEKHELLATAIFPTICISLIFAILLIVIDSELLSDLLFDIPSFKYSTYVLLVIISSLLIRFLSLVLRMKEEGLWYSLSQISTKFLLIILIVVSICTGFESDFNTLIISYSLSVITALLTFIFLLRKEILAVVKASFNKSLFKSMFKYGFPLILGGLAYWVLLSADRYALKYYSSLTELGVYSIAISISSIASIIGAVFNTLWAPTVYKWATEETSLNKIDTISEYVQLISVIIFFVVGISSNLVTYFLPSEYYMVKYIIPLAISAPILYTITETTSIGLGLIRKTSFVLYASILSAICNILGNIILVPKLGATGAAISTAISFWIFFFIKTEFSSYYWRRIAGYKPHLSTLVCILASIFTSFEIDYHLKFVLWFVTLIFCGYVYRKCILELCRKLMPEDRKC